MGGLPAQSRKSRPPQATSTTFTPPCRTCLCSPRKRDGDFVGIESATPRTTITGPLIKDKVAFTESFEYRFIRTPVESLPPLERDMKFEGFTWFNQVDVNLNSRQTMTASFTLNPAEAELPRSRIRLRPSHLRPICTSAGTWPVYSTASRSAPIRLLVSQFSLKGFDADVTANSTAPYELAIETTNGGFFDRQARRSKHVEWREIYQFERHGPLGAHHLKIGTDYTHDNYDGRTTLMPVTIVGAANFQLERIDFGPTSRFHVSQNSLGWFLADHWQPLQRLTLDLGLRFDRDSITDTVNPAPRAGFALMLTKDSKTVLKGGAGLFYARVPLNVASFPLLPDRTIATLSPAGEVVSSQHLPQCSANRSAKPSQRGLERRVGSAGDLGSGREDGIPSTEYGSRFCPRSAAEPWPSDRFPMKAAASTASFKSPGSTKSGAGH